MSKQLLKKRPCPRCLGTGKETKTGGKVDGHGRQDFMSKPKPCRKCNGRKVI